MLKYDNSRYVDIFFVSEFYYSLLTHHQYCWIFTFTMIIKRLMFFLTVACTGGLGFRYPNHISPQLDQSREALNIRLYFNELNNVGCVGVCVCMCDFKSVFKMCELLQVYRVSTLDGLPLITVLTNTTVYLTGLDPVTDKYCNFHVIAYKNLDTVIVSISLWYCIHFIYTTNVVQVIL